MSSKRELIVDNFAGGGGTSTGIEAATGIPVDVAINHDWKATAMHKVNHPRTKHLCQDVFSVDPVALCRGRPVGLAWFSPDCKHFSKAKGGKPVDKKIRDLAWVVHRWASKVRPRIIMLENVEEFRTWGPVLPNGKPCRERRGMTFELWWRHLKRMGYTLDMNELVACDYGAPTSRKRLFVVARCDDRPIVWPEPTHGPGRIPYRTIAECIDWSIPCPSIFLSPAEAKALGVKRPLAENTLRRIATGVWRYVINAAEPFIVPITHTGDSRVHSIQDPLRTITTASRGEMALIQASFIAQHNGGFYKGDGRKVDAPLSTITHRGTQQQLVSAFLSRFNGKSIGGYAGEPLGAIATHDKDAIVTSHLMKLKGTCRHGHDMREPAPAIQAGGFHLAEVRAFLINYYSNGSGKTGCAINKPAPTITTNDRLGLVTVHGVDYQIVDIGMRMLTPRELYRAQGFPDSYIIDRDIDGNPFTKTEQVRMVGNSVCPPVAKALVEANYVQAVRQRRARRV